MRSAEASSRIAYHALAGMRAGDVRDTRHTIAIANNVPMRKARFAAGSGPVARETKNKSDHPRRSGSENDSSNSRRAPTSGIHQGTINSRMIAPRVAGAANNATRRFSIHRRR